MVTQTLLPIPGDTTATVGIVVRCARCHRVLIILPPGGSVTRGTVLVCGKCAAVKIWIKRRR